MDEQSAVLAANEAFYRVFREGDGDALIACFARDAPIATAHPWRPVVLGREAVLEGWRAILGDPPPIRPVDPRVSLLGDVALVTCIEDVGADPCVATNVFVREDGSWRLCHHHGAPLAAVFGAGSREGPVH